jgi:endonuclease/exonuclease/phosphatase family metal-dependent hydrolase
MTTKLRVASFNTENLFTRARILNLRDRDVANDALEKVSELQECLKKAHYTAADKKKILALYAKLKKEKYIDIREDQGKLFAKKGHAVADVAADGCGAWNGSIVFTTAKFSEAARNNTAKVIKDVAADVLCVVEAESLPVLRAFNSDLLRNEYKYAMLVDAMDPRGIDVGLLSACPFGNIRTHMYETKGRSRIFSRDCLEVEVQLPGEQVLHVLCNHLKSQGFGDPKKNDAKRAGQAQRLAEILEGYNLKEDLVVVAGDFNDSPDRKPYTLKPLLTTKNLYDVLELQFPNDPKKRWTYHYKKSEQIDYILVSEPLKQAFQEAGVCRRGIYQVDKITGGAEEPYPTVTHWSDAASDHGAVWAEFRL